MNDSIFLQARYRNSRKPRLAREGCNFLTLAREAKKRYPLSFPLKTEEDILNLADLTQLQGIVGEDFFIHDAPAYLKILTGRKFKQMCVPVKVGIRGKETFIPIHFPTKDRAITIGCYRKTDNPDSTHFSAIETRAGNIFSSINSFNTLGEQWLEEKKDTWYASDKRVYIEI